MRLNEMKLKSGTACKKPFLCKKSSFCQHLPLSEVHSAMTDDPQLQAHILREVLHRHYTWSQGIPQSSNLG